MNADKRILSISAFTLFILGVTAPFWMAAFTSDDTAAVFTVIATILALALGGLSWKFLLGKVAAIGALAICILGSINYAYFKSAQKNARAKAELEQTGALETIR